MNERRKSDSVWKNMWQCIVTAYKGSSWTATLTDPLSTSLYSYETTKLKDAFSNLSEKLFTDAKGESAPATVPKMAGELPLLVGLELVQERQLLPQVASLQVPAMASLLEAPNHNRHLLILASK